MPADSRTGLPFLARLRSPFDGRLRLMLCPRQIVDTPRFGVADKLEEWLVRGDPADTPWSDRLAQVSFSLETGTIRPGEQRAVCALVRSLRPRRVLEIGTYLGASTAAIAIGLESIDGGEVVTVDVRDVNDTASRPWEGDGGEESPAALLSRLGLRDLVTFHARRSLDYLREEGGEFDLVFLDGDHEAATVYQEVALASCRLRPGGFLLLHDYFPKGTPIGAIQNFMRGPYWAMERAMREAPDLVVRSLSPLPWPAGLETHATTLALVGRRS